MLRRHFQVDPKDILNSRQSLKLAQGLSRIIPPSMGYRLAYLIADLISARKDWNQVKAVRCNQWVVGGDKLSKADLDRAVRDTFRNIAHSVYDLHHYVNDPEAIDRLIEFGPAIQSIIDDSQSNLRGKIVVSLHLGNFDLALQALTLRGLRGLVFMLPATEGGYQVQYQIRRRVGVELQPIDMNSLRQAVTRLKEGGTVITMADWPVPESKYTPSFFGRPSAAPVHYVYLALKARVPIVETVMLRRADGTYHFLVSEPITMQVYADKHTEIMRNTEMALKVAEQYVQEAPTQWAMSRPVWPNLLDDVPG